MYFIGIVISKKIKDRYVIEWTYLFHVLNIQQNISVYPIKMHNRCLPEINI